MKSLRNALLWTSALLLSAPLLGCWDAGTQHGGNWRTDFSKHVVQLEEIVSGGPSKDGIPASMTRSSSRYAKPNAALTMPPHHQYP